MLQTDGIAEQAHEHSSAPDHAHIGIARLPNLGSKSATMLASVGITTLAQLRARGAVAAYVAVKRVHAEASLNLLYALVAASEGGNWKTVQRERKLELMLAIEDYQSQPHG
jgi:DNA transformation protein